MRQPDLPKPDTGGKEPEAEKLRSRLDALKADLGEMIAEEEAEHGARRKKGSDGGAMGMGLRAGSELGAGVIVGGGIGWLLDRQTGFEPLFLITFLLLGMAAGFWNIYRLSARTGRRGGNGK